MPSDNGRKGDWITLNSGITFWPLDPRAEEVHIEDIAHALSHICRWGGHCGKFYSVAQHSVLVSRLGRSRNSRRWGLLHDSAEAYIGDVVRPIKRQIPAFKDAEERLLEAIAERFGLELPIPEDVKWADEVVLASEACALMPGNQPGHLIPGRPDPELSVVPIPPYLAKMDFLSTFHSLFPEHAK